jgi:hypothetical protein
MLASVRLSAARHETLLLFSLYQKYRRNMSTQLRVSDITVAVLFQDIEPPVINGVRKPKKPNGTYA